MVNASTLTAHRNPSSQASLAPRPPYQLTQAPTPIHTGPVLQVQGKVRPGPNGAADSNPHHDSCTRGSQTAHHGRVGQPTCGCQDEQWHAILVLCIASIMACLTYDSTARVDDVVVVCMRGPRGGNSEPPTHTTPPPQRLQKHTDMRQSPSDHEG
jgi:hypothetical protein